MKKERKNRVSKSKCSKKWEKFRNKFTERQISIVTIITEIAYFIILAKIIYDAKDLGNNTLGILTCFGIIGGLFIFYLIENFILNIYNADDENKDCDEDDEN